MWIVCEDLASSQESEGSTWHSDRMSGPSPTVRLINTAKVFCCPECQKVLLTEPQYGTTLHPCKEVNVDPSKSSSAGSHNYARTFQLPDAERAWEESEADYFLRSQGSLAKYDPDSCSWKTYQRSLIEDWEPLQKNLPDCGMTVDGEFYPLIPWEPTTYDEDGGCWPTPTASDWKGRGKVETLIKNRENKETQMRPQYLYCTTFGVFPTIRLWEWMQGYPFGWSELSLWATAWFRPVRGKRLKDC